MRRIIVTPAGRRRYMELLAGHLKAQRSSFDEWHIWLNTHDAEDIAFCRAQDAVVVEAPGSDPSEGSANIHRFFPIDSCEPDALYLRLDDDVVWMEPGFIDSIFIARELEREAFLVMANIVNNAICSHIHWRLGLVDHSGYACMDGTGWQNPHYAEHVHRRLLESHDIEAWKFPRWWLLHRERFSINAISWRGASFGVFGGRVDRNEEQWLTEQATGDLGFNMIYGRAVCAHFAFYTQRGHMDSTDILDLYRKKSEEQWAKSQSSCQRAGRNRSTSSWLHGVSSLLGMTPPS